MRHVDSTNRRLAANILPSLGERPIDEIEAPDLVAMVKAIESRGARDIAKRTLETTGQIFRFGIAHGYAKRNPASEIRPSDILKASHKVSDDLRCLGSIRRGAGMPLGQGSNERLAWSDEDAAGAYNKQVPGLKKARLCWVAWAVASDYDKKSCIADDGRNRRFSTQYQS